jgi:hypothetical protein
LSKFSFGVQTMRFIIKSVLIGVAALTVVLFEGRSGYSLKLPPTQEIAKLSFEEPVRVGGPVWARVEPPNNYHQTFQYPVGLKPDDLGCHEFEVRRNGVLLPRIVVRNSIRPSGGLICGVISIPGRPMKHPGRMPLHLQYRFETPGIYEVRYTRKESQLGPGRDKTLFRSDWTRMEVLPAATAPIASPPQDPVEILSDFLPNLLGFPDGERLSVVLDYLYHPEQTVRRYAANGLGYWPDSVEGEERAHVETQIVKDLDVAEFLADLDDLTDLLASDKEIDPEFLRQRATKNQLNPCQFFDVYS